MVISYIIPYYNLPAAMLEECVQSILKVGTDLADHEIIIIDDASQVDLSERMYAIDPTIIYHRRAENGGLSVARNTGLELSNGNFIQFVDGDDKLLIESYRQMILRLKESNADLLLFNTRDMPLQTGNYYLMNNNLKASACGYIFRPELLNGLRFVPHLIHEDELFTPLLIERTTKVLPTAFKPYFYRQRSGSITHRKDTEWVEKRLDDIRFIIEQLTSGNHRWSKGLQRRADQLMMDYIYQSFCLTRSYFETRSRYNALKEKYISPHIPHHTWTYCLSRWMCKILFLDFRG